MQKSRLIGALALACALIPAGTALAATETVTEAEVVRQAENTPPTNNWVLYTRNAGSGQFVPGPAPAPLGTGSLKLVTPTGADKVFLFNYDHVGTLLSDIDAIGYSTYRDSGASPNQVPAINVQVDVNGAADGGFTTLVYEPVYNGTVVEDAWQAWDADGGNWWSTRAIPGVCAFDCFVPWSVIVAANPDAVIAGGAGVNQGSGNPALNADADALTIDETTYDFEANAEACKKGAWADHTNPTFKNQGDCVSYLATGGRS